MNPLVMRPANSFNLFPFISQSPSYVGVGGNALWLQASVSAPLSSSPEFKFALCTLDSFMELFLFVGDIYVEQ